MVQLSNPTDLRVTMGLSITAIIDIIE